jgi:hypothetical protein
VKAESGFLHHIGNMAPRAIPNTEKKYLSPVEFVARSGLSIATVRRYLDSGVLPKVQFGGRGCRICIPVSALETVTTSRDSPPDQTPLDQTPSSSSDETHGPVAQAKKRVRRPAWYKLRSKD